MTEQEMKVMLDQFKALDLFATIPGYKDLLKKDKEAVLEAFQAAVDKEKAKLANEQ